MFCIKRIYRSIYPSWFKINNFVLVKYVRDIFLNAIYDFYSNFVLTFYLICKLYTTVTNLRSHSFSILKPYLKTYTLCLFIGNFCVSLKTYFKVWLI